MRHWVSLMYHDIVPDGTVRSPVGQRFAVPVAAFGRQLDLLREAGLHGCTLEHAMRDPDPRLVAVTFDDGTLGQYERAFPALAERGMAATFFVTTGWVGRREGYATWPHLREMRAAGMSIQSHTHSHPFLSELDAPALADELERSKALIEDGLGQTTEVIALPGGDAPRRALRPLLSAAGYRVVATSRWGINGVRLPRMGDALAVHRCTIGGEPEAALFTRIISGDRTLARQRRAREVVLATTRRVMGPSRYARYRSLVLEWDAQLRSPRGAPAPTA